MEITISKKQARVPVTIMQVRGKIDSSNYQDFAEAARKVVAEGTEYLLLDLADCEYMSSAGIRSLSEIYLIFGKSFPREGRKRVSRSEHLKLFNPSEKIKEILSISGVDAFFEIHANLETALASF
jgi:anti-anti-sigma factor